MDWLKLRISNPRGRLYESKKTCVVKPVESPSETGENQQTPSVFPHVSLEKVEYT